MDTSGTDVRPARPFGGVPLDRPITAVPGIPRPRQAGSGSPGPGPSRPADVPSARPPFDEDLVERTLAFSGSYVSDDGHVAIRRSIGSFEYSGHRFIGYCHACVLAQLILPTGEPLADVAAAGRFTATHRHDEVD